ncbi:sulfatase [Vibrio inusitatus NBRC 102082]|uniref:Sulfatase n=1 Tax=Vibrio inusitatus NBRC 102082 TaxID=1219070 RepID=A0A4Y3HZ58_9VIBR|nr:sulfatase [Vibrio inusitatus]GEA51852.1 sulfatase [Vibrio inusitatus NBRC 102082]
MENQTRPSPKQPNIIYIMSDDHAVRAVSAYQSDIAHLAPTPNIDRIARNGARFDKSFVTNSLCGPSRAAMLTGKFGHKNGFNHNGQLFDGHQPTWPRLLKEHGYSTACIGKWHINLTPDGLDFDHWELLNDQGEYYNPDFITKQGVKREHGYTTELITEKSLNWIAKQKNSEQPFALLIHHKAPHRNWMPAPQHTRAFENTLFPVPDNYFDTYQGRAAAAMQTMNIYRDAQEGHDLKMTKAVGETQWREDIWPFLLERLTPEQREQWDLAYQDRNDWFNNNEADMSDEDIAIWKYQRYVQDYLATIISVDESVGEVLDYLERHNIVDNTIVIYTSDQGFYMGEHGWFDKRFMYEESFRAPLLIQYPDKIAPNTIVNELVQNIDYAPTFLEYAGIAVTSDIQGQSLVPLLNGGHISEEEGGWRTSLYYHFYEYPAMHDVTRHYGIRDHRYKLMHFYYQIDEWEFYDLDRDPTEMNNAINDPKYLSIIHKLKQDIVKLEHQYDVPPRLEWNDSPLECVSAPTLKDLYPNSYQVTQQ